MKLIHLLVSALTLLAVTSLVMAGCTGCTGGPEPEAIVDKAYAVMDDVKSYRSHTVVTSTFKQATVTTSMQEFAAPDRYHFITLMRDMRWQEIIVAGSTGYLRSSEFPGWKECGKTYEIQGETIHIDEIPDPGRAATSNQSLYIDSVEAWEELPEQRIDAKDCFHFKGEVDTEAWAEKLKARAKENVPEETSERYREMVEPYSERIRESEMTVEIWIDKEDYFIRKSRSERRFPVVDVTGEGERQATQVSVTRSYDFNESIEIELPEPEDVSKEVP